MFGQKGADTFKLLQSASDTNSVRQQLIIDGGNDNDLIQLMLSNVISDHAHEVIATGGDGINSLMVGFFPLPHSMHLSCIVLILAFPCTHIQVNGTDSSDCMALTSKEILGSSYVMKWTSWQLLNILTHGGDDIIDILSTPINSTIILAGLFDSFLFASICCCKLIDRTCLDWIS
jgi:hypothetical protein